MAKYWNTLSKKDKNAFFFYVDNYSYKESSYPDIEVYEKSKTEREPDSRYKVISKKAILEITSDHYPEVVNYCESEKIKLDTIEGLVNLIDYYLTLNKN